MNVCIKHFQEIIKETDLRRRAELVLDNADILDARVFVTPNDIVSENGNLNLAFVANLFKNHSGLNSSEVELPEEAISILETREERSEFKEKLSFKIHFFTKICTKILRRNPGFCTQAKVLNIFVFVFNK